VVRRKDPQKIFLNKKIKRRIKKHNGKLISKLLKRWQKVHPEKDRTQNFEEQ
jgi:hypothetical protein